MPSPVPDQEPEVLPQRKVYRHNCPRHSKQQEWHPPHRPQDKYREEPSREHHRLPHHREHRQQPDSLQHRQCRSQGLCPTVRGSRYIRQDKGQ